jgi:hypothetical protein
MKTVERDKVQMLTETLKKYAEQFKPVDSHPSDVVFI